MWDNRGTCGSDWADHGPLSLGATSVGHGKRSHCLKRLTGWATLLHSAVCLQEPLLRGAGGARALSGDTLPLRRGYAQG